jgi:hypothetical protein
MCHFWQHSCCPTMGLPKKRMGSHGPPQPHFPLTKSPSSSRMCLCQNRVPPKFDGLSCSHWEIYQNLGSIFRLAHQAHIVGYIRYNIYICVCVCSYISPWVPLLKYNEFSAKFPVHHFCWFKSYHNMFCFLPHCIPLNPMITIFAQIICLFCATIDLVLSPL